MYHHVGGRRHTPLVCNERREPYTSHYPSRQVTKIITNFLDRMATTRTEISEKRQVTGLQTEETFLSLAVDRFRLFNAKRGKEETYLAFH